MFNLILPALAKYAGTKIAMSAGQQLIATTAAQAIGTSIDARQAERRAASNQANFYVNMRNAALKAGFNPLSVLNSGTAGAFSAAGEVQYGPLSSMNFVGIMQEHERNQQMKMESEQRIKNMQLEAQQMTRLTAAKARSDVQNEIVEEPLKMEVSAKNWKQLTQKQRTLMANAESVKANAKIEGLADTKSSVKMFGYDVKGSGYFSSAAAFEESFGDGLPQDLIVAPMLMGDAALATISRGVQKNIKGVPSLTARTGKPVRGEIYKYHKEDQRLGSLPPTRKKIYVFNGQSYEGWPH